MIPIALHYLGLDPHSGDPAELQKAADLLKSIRPYVQNFHSSQYVGSLANGGTCLVVGWSGDIIQARDRAEEASNGVHVAYSIPKEGAPQWFDMLAIPKDAKHPEAAYRFINYLLEPKVAAANTNFIHYANPVPTATPLVDEAIRTDPTIYPCGRRGREDVHLLDQHAGDRQALHPAVDRGEDRALNPPARRRA